MRTQRKLYEGSGPTLDAALADFPGKKRLCSLEIPRVEISISRGDQIIASYNGSDYRRARTAVRAIAKINTHGQYKPFNPDYTTEVSVKGYYKP